jgi:hypothetical protein
MLPQLTPSHQDHAAQTAAQQPLRTLAGQYCTEAQYRGSVDAESKRRQDNAKFFEFWLQDDE